MQTSGATCLWSVTAPASRDVWRGPSARAVKSEWTRRWWKANPEKVAGYIAKNREKRHALKRDDPGAYRAFLDGVNRRRGGTREMWTAYNRSAFAKQVANKYGLAVEDYARMEHAQDRRCAACRDSLMHPSWEDRESRGRALNRVHVDHNHVTGKVRGLLCGHCNAALGLAKDCSARLLNLALYLEKFQAKEQIYAVG